MHMPAMAAWTARMSVNTGPSPIAHLPSTRRPGYSRSRFRPQPLIEDLEKGGMTGYLHRLAHRFRARVGLFVLGLALGSGTLFVGQSCLASGQCASCGACVSRLPVLAVPLLVGGAVVLAHKIGSYVRKRLRAQVS